VRRWRWPLAGACAAAAAWPLAGTPAGALCWGIAAGVACLGYGRALDRAGGAASRPALAVTGGLAVMLVLGTVLAQLGLLVGAVQVALVLGGVALAALPREAEPDGAGPRESVDGTLGGAFGGALGVLAAVVLVAVAVARGGTSTADGLNHVLAVKRLWDTGGLEAIPSAAGLLVVGEALFVRGGGPELAGVFDAGLCAALLIYLVAGELVAGELGKPRAGSARLVLALATIAIVIEPPVPGQMLATLLHVAALLALRAAITEGRTPSAAITEGRTPPAPKMARRTAWVALAAAAGLALVRHELVFLAVPYGVAAVALPRVERLSRGVIALAMVAWFAVLCGIQIALGLPPAAALGKGILLLAAVPLAAALLRLLGTSGWRSVHGVMCLALTTYLLALATYAVQPVHHAPVATTAALLGVALAILVAAHGAAEPGHAASGVRVGTASVVLAMLAATSLALPNFRFVEVDRIASRFSFAVVALRERLVLGPDRAPAALGALQLRTPAGAGLAFWGKSAAHLDFARNRIRDVSFAGRTFLGPIAPRRLEEIDYLLIEDVRAAPRIERGRDPAFEPALGELAERLELEAAADGAYLFRVRP
jgi:hypothetical protein